MKKMLLIFSHRLTEKQIRDASKNLNVNEFIYLPDDLQNLWSSIPANVYNISPFTEKIKSWITETANKDDYVLVQGDFGATYDIVSFCKTRNLRPVYSTTVRKAKEETNKFGEVEVTHIFEHVLFREYY